MGNRKIINVIRICNATVKFSYDFVLFHQQIFEHYSRDKRKFQLELLKQHMQCGNSKCKISYFAHKYGIEIEILRREVEMSTFSTIKLKKINKWYICSKCKLIYYCS